jgi:hypothetical protein
MTGLRVGAAHALIACLAISLLGPPPAKAAPMVQAVQLTFMWGKPKCGRGYDFSCFAVIGYLLTDNPAEVVQLTEKDNDEWHLTMDQAMVFPQQAKGLVPLLRLYNPGSHDHFYTTSQWEADEGVKYLGYVSEGVCCFIAPTQLPGTVPLFRFRSGGFHYYQLSATPSYSPDDDSEGPAGFVWPVTTPPPTLEAAQNPPAPPAVPAGKVAAVPLYELAANSGNDALITDNADEAFELRNVFRSAWRGREPEFSVFPAPAIGTVALLRFDNPTTQDHLFTTDTMVEVPTLKGFGYNPEGTCCWISLTPFPNAQAIHRLRKGSQHRFVVDALDVATYMRLGYIEEGITGYVWIRPPDNQPLLKNKQ